MEVLYSFSLCLCSEILCNRIDNDIFPFLCSAGARRFNERAALDLPVRTQFINVINLNKKPQKSRTQSIVKITSLKLTEMLLI